MTQLPPVPVPPPVQVQRFDASGKATTAQATYEASLTQFLKAVKAAVEAG